MTDGTRTTERERPTDARKRRRSRFLFFFFFLTTHGDVSYFIRPRAVGDRSRIILRVQCVVLYYNIVLSYGPFFFFTALVVYYRSARETIRAAAAAADPSRDDLRRF